jgi:hypothetical protein
LDIAERIAGHIKEGVSLRCAAGLEMVPWGTFTEWLQKGREGHEPYVMFSDLTSQAEAEAEAKAAKRILVAGEKEVDGDWKAMSWWLERRRREDWWLRPEPPKEASKMTDDELKSVIAEQAEKWAATDPAFAEALLARLKK